MTRTFPPDEFDVDDPGTGRRGAHRARPNPLVAVVPLVLVTVAVVAIIVGAMTLLGGSSTPPAGVPDAGADVPAQSETESPVETPAPGASEPEPSDEATEPAAPSEPAEPEPTVDQSLPVTVLNGTTTSGLAAAAAEELRAAGYAVVSTDNFREGDPPPTTVYYSAEEASATAAAIAEELGTGQTELDPSRGEGVVVVLGEDYAGP